MKGRGAKWLQRLAAATLATAFVAVVFVTAPASGHVSSAFHLWKQHIKPKVLDAHYTKSQSNSRYYTRSQANSRYYTRSQANSRYYTRSQADSRYYTRSQADSRYYTRSQADSRYAPLRHGDLARYCDTLPAPDQYAPCAELSTAVYDVADEVGLHTSMTIGVDGLPIIAIQNGTDDSLEVVHCNDPACGSTTTTVLSDPADVVGEYTSIAIGAGGRPVISYYNATTGRLHVAACNNVKCTSAALNQVDTDGNDVGKYSSIAVRSNGLPVIAYYDETSDALKYARCTTETCSASQYTVIENNATPVGEYVSLALGADGLPVMSYFDKGAGTVKVARCSAVECNTGASVEVIEAIGSAVWPGFDTDVAIGADGFPVVTYVEPVESVLTVAHCDDVACAGDGERITDVEATGATYHLPQVAVGVDGFPLVAYAHETLGEIRLVDCNDLGCTGGDETVRSIADMGLGEYFPALAVAPDGMAVVAYHDPDDAALRVVRTAT